MRLAAAIVLIGVACLAAVPTQSADEGTLPAGWIRAGSHPGEYEMGIDPSGSRAGKPCAFIRARAGASSTHFGTLMQMFDASDYVGKRVRLIASVKSEGIASWAGLWMRVDGAPDAGTGMPKMLAFDNMQNRPIKGTSGWTPYSVVLDVPPEARAVAFGILLSGPGGAWMDDLRLEAVGTDVPVTGMAAAAPTPSKKPNLSFEK
jgi:hypothetical protein